MGGLPNYGRGNGDLLQKTYASTPPRPAAISAPDPVAGHFPPMPLLNTAKNSQQVPLSLLWDHFSFLLDPGVHKMLFVLSKNLCFPWHGSSVTKSHWSSKSDSQGILSPFVGSPGWEVFVSPRTFAKC